MRSKRNPRTRGEEIDMRGLNRDPKGLHLVVLFLSVVSAMSVVSIAVLPGVA
jgi:hypothetical protein